MSDSAGTPLQGLLTFAQMRDRYESDPHRKAAIEAKRRSMAPMLGNGLRRPLATLRLSAGMSRVDLAERLGAPLQFLSRLESGLIKNIAPDALGKRSIALNVSVEAVENALKKTPLPHP